MITFLRACEETCLRVLETHLPRCAPFARRHARVWRYIVSGGTAAVVDLTALYALTDWLGVHYLLSATLAFLVAFLVSFTLQKFWTFEETSTHRIPTQLTLYLVIAAANTLVNAGLMYLFVDVFGLWYLLAQIIAGAVIACYGFLLYHYVIFRKQTHEDSHHNPEGGRG
ncbi:MAG: GtrA family protein [Parcubacteria group bacterium Greene0416_79]|nr:MAG: GtrA family protein [Parcubacteria group bacterium Greene0416_79]